MAQSLKRLMLDLSSGLDLRVTSSSSALDPMLDVDPTLKKMRGTWVAQLVEHLTLGFCSVHDLMVHGFEPHIGLSLPLSLSLSLPLP